MIRGDESGYSMVEVLVAIIILTIAIVPMFAMFDLGLRTATTNSNLDKARALAEKQMELAQSVPYTEAETTQPRCTGVPVATPGNDSNCTDESPAYDGLEFAVKKTHIGFLEDPESDASEINLVEVSEDESQGMIQIVVTVSRVGDSEPLFTTTGVVTE